MKTVEVLLRDKSTWPAGFQTKCGAEVRILCDDFQEGDFRIIAAVKAPLSGDGWEFRIYNYKGEYYGSCSSERDLIPRPVKHKGWVLIGDRGRHCYHYQASHIYATREQALASGREDTSGATACIEVEFQEGDGL
jgi:hypothetical protein